MMHFPLHRLLLFFLFLYMTKGKNQSTKLVTKYSEVEKEALKSLVTQYLKAFEKYMEVKCLKSKTENIQRGFMKKATSKVKLLVWDSFGEANQLIQDMADENTFTNKSPKPDTKSQETVIIANDIGEDPKSSKKKKIIRKIMKKKPKAKIISLDWSEIVS